MCISRDVALQVRQEAYEKAVQFCKVEFKRDRKAQDTWLAKSTSIADVARVLDEARAKYEIKRAGRSKGVAKTSACWSAACSGIRHYVSVVDVMVSSNPEYAALAWGAMRFLVMVSMPSTEGPLYRSLGPECIWLRQRV